VLLLSGAARSTEPTEPLTVTRLGDSESELLVSAASGPTGNPGSGAGEFRSAITDALRAQQQSIQASCQSALTATNSIAVRWAWQARCRYKRY
jgi:hypothetical protein